MSEAPLTYASAGVDIAAADRLVTQISEIARATHGSEVKPGPGAFAALFEIAAGTTLAAACDGVGTKLHIARDAGRYEGIGRDLVAMNVNDLAVVGARPLLFLDYIAAGTLDPGPILDIVKGAAAACKSVGCALLGGETAEMPGLYRPGDLDVAGFAVGLVDPAHRPNPGTASAGDQVFGLASSGIHANGMTLARAALDRGGVKMDVAHPMLGHSIIDELLEPTALYPSILDDVTPPPKAYSHVTGGGLEGRSAALVAGDARVHIDFDRFDTPPIFGIIQEAGGVQDVEMERTFNLGLGFLAAIAPSDVPAWSEAGRGWIHVGEIRPGESGAEIHR